jgi:UDP-glucose 4-epimerase
MATYLVTGGCGFIGSHLVDALCRCGHDVRIIDDLSTGKPAYKPAQAELIRGDVAAPGVVAEAMQGVAGCFHLAAVASVERGHADWLGTHRTNLTGTIAVLDAAWRTSPQEPVPVVFASSAAVYGDNRNTPLREDDRPRPLSAYGADKFSCELHALVGSRLHRVPTCGLRFFNVYGPRQDPASPYSGVISIFCDRLRAGRAVIINGDGRQQRDFVFVDDVVRALRAAMDNCSVAGDILNVCTGTSTSIRDLAELAGSVVGVEPEVRFAPPRKGDIRSSVGDPAKARRLLGFAAETGLEAGLRSMLGADRARATGIPARAA